MAASYTFGVSSLPTLAETDEVQFFYLETALPFNAPLEVVAKAGSSFTAYAAAHCGLGVYDATTNVKFSIEFVALNYTGALLPTGFDERNATWRWNNAGSLAVALPFSDAAWTNSRLVSITSGTAWIELVSWLRRNYQGDLYYQPVSVVAAPPSGAVLVRAFDSYALVQAAVAQLASFGAPLNSLVTPATTSFVYYTAVDATAPAVVSWDSSPDDDDGNELAPANVRAWFLQLSTCYHAKFAQLTPAQDGFSFLASVQSCYSSGAPSYVYLSPTSAYSLQLAASPLSPTLLRAPYALPSTPSPAADVLTATDLGFLIALVLLISCGAVLFAKHVLCQRNSRLAAEMDKMADEAVGSILEGHESGRDSLYEYFYPRQRGLLARARDWLSGSSGGFSGVGSGGGRRAEGKAQGGLSGLSTRELAREYRAQQRSQPAAAVSSSNPFRSTASSAKSLNPFADDEDPPYYALSEHEPLMPGQRNTVSV